MVYSSMGKTCGSVAMVPVGYGADTDAHTPERACHTALLVHGCAACLRLALLAFVTYSFAVTAWRVRQQPWDLAFIFGAYAALAGLLLCLRHVERLTPDSPAAQRRWLHAAVWALSTVLSCTFAYRVMPAALVVVIWCMTSFVVLVGFYMLVLCKDQQYQVSVDEVVCDAAGDAKPLMNKILPSDQMV